MLTTDLDYHLPDSHIATHAADPRDSARLMVVSRTDASLLEHAHIRDLPRFLSRGDRLILNTTRVLRARLIGRKPSGGRVEGLFLSQPDPAHWHVLLGASHLHPGTIVHLLLENAQPGGLELELLERIPHQPGGWVVRLRGQENSAESAAATLERIGRTPLPPYILKARQRTDTTSADDLDRARYQTVFARELQDAAQSTPEFPGSVAAPTAGLHFTPELLHTLKQNAVYNSPVTLHVGTGTFRSVETDTVEAHPMHAEHCSMPLVTEAEILHTRQRGGRILCVGTTAARTVETFAQQREQMHDSKVPRQDWINTRILITPGYPWRWTDGMLTNFHLPRSTLMAMIAALLEPSGGLTRLQTLYALAIKQNYRFYSYGDAMLILP